MCLQRLSRVLSLLLHAWDTDDMWVTIESQLSHTDRSGCQASPSRCTELSYLILTYLIHEGGFCHCYSLQTWELDLSRWQAGSGALTGHRGDVSTNACGGRSFSGEKGRDSRQVNITSHGPVRVGGGHGGRGVLSQAQGMRRFKKMGERLGQRQTSSQCLGRS